uniref:Uncharacterized protein n=1 Tax=Compsopogon caeruleus TaxID=31354 RepID=A0A7S1XEY8_9RHOD|mmetsp:Transcript_2777/g.5106  ORF Transcript_2777/g.5106 Transcript_2777/m.5106 type:complete len:468 (+) Transcript_2777:890-2293(+)
MGGEGGLEVVVDRRAGDVKGWRTSKSVGNFENDEEELQLEDALFGRLKRVAPKREDELRVSKLQRSKEDGGGSRAAWVDEDDLVGSVSLVNVSRLRKLRKRAGESSVSRSEYEKRLRDQFRVTYAGMGSWAREASATATKTLDVSEAEGESAIQSLLRIANPHPTNSKVLTSGTIDIVRRPDANGAQLSKAVVQSVNYHPAGELLLTGGFDKRVRQFRVTGPQNVMVHTVFLPNFPVYHAEYILGGDQILASSRRPFLYQIDVASESCSKMTTLSGGTQRSFESFTASPTGKTLAFAVDNGGILVAAAYSKQEIAFLKMRSPCISVAFTETDDHHLVSYGVDGLVCLWDLRTKKCFRKFSDEGCVRGKVVSSRGKFLACGSDSGIVNIYDLDELAGGLSKPIKTVGNLTTSIHSMTFNHDAELFAFSSFASKNSVRYVDSPLRVREIVGLSYSRDVTIHSGFFTRSQ